MLHNSCVGTDEQLACPRCTAPMQRRLTEFECSACGHFESAKPAKRVISNAAKRPALPHAHNSSPPGAPLPARSYDERMALPRRICLALFALQFVGLGAVAVIADGEPLTAKLFASLIFGGLFWTVVLSAFLYADWAVAKYIGLVAVVAAIAFSVWDIMLSQPTDSWRIAGAATSIFICWCAAVLLVLDLRQHS